MPVLRFTSGRPAAFAPCSPSHDSPPASPSVLVTPLPHAQEQIHTALADCTLSLNPADWFDVQEPIVRSVYVDLPSHARQLYRDMERDMFMEIGEHAVEAVNAAARTMACLELVNGAVYIDDAGNWKEVHDAKLQALESIVEEAAGVPVLVAYHFKSDLARLRRTFPRGRVLDHHAQTIRDWNAGKIPILFAHPASAGHGLNLQDGGNILAFFSRSWDLEAFQQSSNVSGRCASYKPAIRAPYSSITSSLATRSTRTCCCVCRPNAACRTSCSMP